ncbi:MAG: glycosyltransferase family 9 protein [Phycisphaerae bacterium]|nr:glycosyltransferase family 9 protein [Phycisphaerae bacterium]
MIPSFRNILFLHGGALGDFVLTLHVVAAVRRLAPQARVDGIVRCPLARWAVGQGLLTAAFDPEDVGLHTLFAGQAELSASLTARLAGADVAISFLGGPESAAAVALRDRCPGTVVAIDPRPTPETLAAGRHVTRQWSDALATAGLDARVTDAALFHKAEPIPPAAPVMVHPGSGGRDKCCPLPVLEVVVRHLLAAGRAVAWMIGPVEEDQQGPAFAQRLAQTAPVTYEASLGRATEVIRSAAAFIGNDAGMTHLAAACGVPTIALFGPTDPRVWRPRGPDVRVLPLDFASASTEPGGPARDVIDLLAADD